MQTTLKRWDAEVAPTAVDGAHNYIGPDLGGYYVAPVGNTRDTRGRERTRFYRMVASLKRQSSRVEVVRMRHWACGWFEVVLIPADDTKGIKAAERWNRKAV